MGWTGGNTVFDPVARKARELGLTDEQVTGLLTIVIRELQDRGWDTEDESLREFRDDEAIVAAFRAQEIIIVCGEHVMADGHDRWCELERDHKDEEHEDWKGKFRASG